MKKKSFLIVLFALSTFFLTSCQQKESTNPCSPVNVGEVTLKKLSDDFKPDPNTATSLIFINENGNETELLQTKYIKQGPAIIRLRKEPNYDCNGYKFYDMTTTTVIYSGVSEHTCSEHCPCRENIIEIYRSTVVAKDFLPEEEYLFDKIDIRCRFEYTIFGSIVMMTSARGNESILTDAFESSYSNFNFDERIELAGTIYENVYSSNLEDSSREGKIFMTKETGLIGFIDKEGMFWKLKTDDDN